MFGVWCLVFGVWCLVFVSCLVFDICCLFVVVAAGMIVDCCCSDCILLDIHTCILECPTTYCHDFA